MHGARFTLMLLAALAAWAAAVWSRSLYELAAPSRVLLARAALAGLAVALLAAAVFLPRLSDLLDRALTRWSGPGLPRRRRAGPAATALTALLVVGMTGILVGAISDPGTMRVLAREDGPVESLTAVCYLLGAAITLLAAVRMPLWRPAWLLTGLAALMGFVGMEEISWGQRILGVEAPAFLDRVNVQGELNLHNVWSTSITQYAGLAVSGVLLLAAPAADRYSRRLRRLFRGLDVPMAPWRCAPLFVASLVVFFVVGLQLGTVGIGPFSSSGLPPHIDDEFLELFLAILFLTAATAGWSFDLRAILAADRPAATAAAVSPATEPTTPTPAPGVDDERHAA